MLLCYCLCVITASRATRAKKKSTNDDDEEEVVSAKRMNSSEGTLLIPF